MCASMSDDYNMFTCMKGHLVQQEERFCKCDLSLYNIYNTLMDVFQNMLDP